MIEWLLARLEKNPHAVFTERELIDFDARQFARLCETRLLRRVPSLSGVWYCRAAGSLLAVVRNEDGSYEAIDEENPEAEPIPLEVSDIACWHVDFESIARTYQQRNGFHGKPSAIDDRLFYMGEILENGRSVAFTLGLLNHPTVAERHLKALPNSVSARHDDFVIICPTFAPTPSLQRDLESLRIHLVPIGENDPFMVTYSLPSEQQVRKGPRILLSDDEEREFHLQGYKSQHAIHITGRIEGRKGNIIEVAGRDVLLTDAPFRLFLRLVVALHEHQDGFLSRQEVRYGAGPDSEELLAPEGLDQAISRVRKPFHPALNGLKPKQFIEMRDGRVRLSTHRRYVTWDRELLQRHLDTTVQELVNRLPK